MVFASIVFLFRFLPANLVLYFLHDNKTYRNLVLVAFSMFFYAWGEPLWIIILIISATVDFVNGQYIERYRGSPKARVFLVVSICINLALLIIFKYSAFLYENVNAIFGLSLDVPKIALPIGISFYTFQTISYVVDVYRGDVKAQRSYLPFMLFVSLYHQLVAGPIVRYIHIENEINNRKHYPEEMARGFVRFCFGLFKKVYFANIAGSLVAQYLDIDPSAMTTLGSWYGLLMFALQIYFDFSGYSDMAIGLGWMFGFHYHENFNYPYIAKSATEFWRRWHISLGNFFRDYVYIPMGGNRRNATFNLFVVWFLTGLWHGASWNFILWGLYFGILIWIERMFLMKALAKVPAFVSHVYLIFVALFGWVIFYFTDTAKMIAFFGVLFGNAKEWGDVLLLETFKGNLWWMLVALVCCTPVYYVVVGWMERRIPQKVNYWVAACGGIIMFAICVTLLVGNSYNPFLYFRF